MNMKTTLTLVLCLCGTTTLAQQPGQWTVPAPTYFYTPAPMGWGYMNRDEAMAQQRFDNQLRMRQQAAFEARTPESNYVLDFAEQTARIQALRAQRDYYESQTAPPSDGRNAFQRAQDRMDRAMNVFNK